MIYRPIIFLKIEKTLSRIFLSSSITTFMEAVTAIVKSAAAKNERASPTDIK